MNIKIFIKLFIIILLLNFTVSCTKEVKVNDLHKSGIKGEVSSYFEKHYEPVLKAGQWKKGRIANYGNNKVIFDYDGNYILAEYYGDQNEQIFKIIPKRKDKLLVEELLFDNFGKLIHQTKIKELSDQKKDFTSFDAEGKVIKKGKSLLADHILVKQKIKEVQKEGISEYLLFYEYDVNGNLQSQKKMSLEGKVLSFERYEYLDFDEKNNWIKRHDYSSEDAKEPYKIVIREFEYHQTEF
ncbi:hypothetical protein [Ascidiimonas sp. W6]|uniref:hypothetical protein n=1 Tax=Ascidiimonas meishanensis TaxID=3128903 RepID=UPI0030EB7E1F